MVSVGMLSGFRITPPDGRSEGERSDGESLTNGGIGVNDKRVPMPAYKAGTAGAGITGDAAGGVAIGSLRNGGSGRRGSTRS